MEDDKYFKSGPTNLIELLEATSYNGFDEERLILTNHIPELTIKPIVFMAELIDIHIKHKSFETKCRKYPNLNFEPQELLRYQRLLDTFAGTLAKINYPFEKITLEDKMRSARILFKFAKAADRFHYDKIRNLKILFSLHTPIRLGPIAEEYLENIPSGISNAIYTTDLGKITGTDEPVDYVLGLTNTGEA